MITVDLAQMEGRRYPARRRTQNIVGGASPIQAKNFSIGNVTLDPNGGQVPWHNQEQEEVYLVLNGTAGHALLLDCWSLESRLVPLDAEQDVAGVIANSRVHHDLAAAAYNQRRQECEAAVRFFAAQLSGVKSLRDVAHWKQELSGTLPVAGVDVPPLPPGACPQCTEKPAEAS